MANKDSGWRPTAAMDAFGDYEIWEYNLGPHEINTGEVDGEIDFDDYDGDFPTSVDEIEDEE